MARCTLRKYLLKIQRIPTTTIVVLDSCSSCCLHISHLHIVSISICRISGIDCTDRPIFGLFTLATNKRFLLFSSLKWICLIFFFSIHRARMAAANRRSNTVFIYSLHAAKLQLMCNSSSPNSHFNDMVSAKQNKQWPIGSISIFARFCSAVVLFCVRRVRV